ncbi:MAG: DUF4115 domain-containing protein [Deltaproteobacteria bacterium]|nr:DUF4115 domain-containing protein [Deltaproteobacteria bacterium]
MEHIALLLRQAREDRGLSLKEAAHRSRIPLSYLEMLEEQKPKSKEPSRPLPDPMYLVPHLRDYAAFLGLDPGFIVSQLTDELQKAPEINLDLTAAPQTPPLRTPASKRSRTLSASIILAAVLVTLAFIGQYSDMDERIPGLGDLQATRPADPPREAEPRPVLPAPAIPLAPPTATAPAAPESVSRAPTPPSAASPAIAQPRSENAPHLLRAQAKEATWIRVIIEGQAPSDMILQPGQSASWTSDSTFVITLGNAGGIILNLDGQELPPLGTTGQFLRNIRLPYSATENQG